MIKRKALESFHYAADGKNPVRYDEGATVPVKPEHVEALEHAGKIEVVVTVNNEAGQLRAVIQSVSVAKSPRTKRRP